MVDCSKQQQLFKITRGQPHIIPKSYTNDHDQLKQTSHQSFAAKTTHDQSQFSSKIKSKNMFSTNQPLIFHLFFTYTPGCSEHDHLSLLFLMFSATVFHVLSPIMLFSLQLSPSFWDHRPPPYASRKVHAGSFPGLQPCYVQKHPHIPLHGNFPAYSHSHVFLPHHTLPLSFITKKKSPRHSHVNCT